MKLSDHLLARLRGKRLLIFDLDGTIADSSRLHATAFSKALAPFGIDVDYPSISGLNTTDAMRHCLLSNGVSIDDDLVADLVAEKQQLVRKMICEGLQPLPGVDDFLRWARSRFRLAMVTSGSRGTVTLALKALDYDSWFDPLICADDVDSTKPNPEGFLAALKKTGVPSAEAFVFEDSATGMLAAENARIECCNVAPPIGFLMFAPDQLKEN